MCACVNVCKRGSLVNPGEVPGILIRRIIMQILIRCIDYHLDLFLEGDLPIEDCECKQSNVGCSDIMARKDKPR